MLPQNVATVALWQRVATWLRSSQGPHPGCDLHWLPHSLQTELKADQQRPRRGPWGPQSTLSECCRAGPRTYSLHYVSIIFYNLYHIFFCGGLCVVQKRNVSSSFILNINSNITSKLETHHVSLIFVLFAVLRVMCQAI